MHKVEGEFEINLSPLDLSFSQVEDASKIGRMSIDKKFLGDLDGHSKGEMLSYMSPNGQSGGYVAIERVQASLKSKKGSFTLQHYGLMNEGKDTLNLEVVPGSGTDDLEGITGKMNIVRKDKKHFYIFEYKIK